MKPVYVSITHNTDLCLFFWLPLFIIYVSFPVSPPLVFNLIWSRNAIMPTVVPDSISCRFGFFNVIFWMSILGIYINIFVFRLNSRLPVQCPYKTTCWDGGPYRSSRRVLLLLLPPVAYLKTSSEPLDTQHCTSSRGPQQHNPLSVKSNCWTAR